MACHLCKTLTAANTNGTGEKLSLAAENTGIGGTDGQ